MQTFHGELWPSPCIYHANISSWTVVVSLYSPCKHVIINFDLLFEFNMQTYYHEVWHSLCIYHTHISPRTLTFSMYSVCKHHINNLICLFVMQVQGFGYSTSLRFSQDSDNSIKPHTQCMTWALSDDLMRLNDVRWKLILVAVISKKECSTGSEFSSNWSHKSTHHRPC